MSVSVGDYVALCVVMFLEYAVWGAWLPVLAARLLGPLKMTGKQTGWIYATVPLASLLSPLLAGPLADKWKDPKFILAACHFVGMVLLLLAVKQRTFRGVFLVMMLYAMCFAATLPLVNAELLSHVSEKSGLRGWVFFWAPVAWALVGYALSGWRFLRKGQGDGSDCLVFAALLSLVMAAACLCLPKTDGGEGTSLLGVFTKLQEFNFLVFLVLSLIISGLMQFYFLGSARFLMDKGLSPKVVPAIMGIAQAAQAAATIFALGFVLTQLGFKSTLLVAQAVGLSCTWSISWANPGEPSSRPRPFTAWRT